MRKSILFLPCVLGCVYDDLPANAYQIATVCGLFYSDWTVAANVTTSTLLTCIDETSHETGEYGEEMFVEFTDYPTSGCAKQVLKFTQNVVTVRADLTNECGTWVATTGWTSANVPTEISEFDAACLAIISTSLATFFYANDFDISRNGDNDVCTSLPAHAFEVLTTCALHDTTNLLNFSDLKSSNILLCIAQFAHASTEYAYDIYTLFDSGTSSCRRSLLTYTKRLFAQRPDGASLCGPVPTGTTGWESEVPLSISAYSFECLNVLSTGLQKFYDINGIDIRDNGDYVPCVSAAVFEGRIYTLEVMTGECIGVPYASFADCVTGLDNSTLTTQFGLLDCKPVYETLYTGLKAGIDSGDLCTSNNTLADYPYAEGCLSDISSLLDDFRVSTGGHTVAVKPQVCNATVDGLVEELSRPFQWLVGASVDDWSYYGYDANGWWLYNEYFGIRILSDSLCRVCYDEFVSDLINLSRSNLFSTLCSSESFYGPLVYVFFNLYAVDDEAYDDFIGACKAFLLEPGNPLDNFRKCAKFDLTVADDSENLPGCKEADFASIPEEISYVSLLECIEDITTWVAIESEYTRSGLLLRSFDETAGCRWDTTGVSPGCDVCFTSFQLALVDISFSVGSSFVCYADPYSSDCLVHLIVPLELFAICMGAYDKIVFSSLETCSVPDDGTQDEFDLAIDLLFTHGIAGSSFEEVASMYTYPFSGRVMPCQKCFEGFISLLNDYFGFYRVGRRLTGWSLWDEDATDECAVTRNSPRCFMQYSKAIKFFETCSGLIITQLPELTVRSEDCQFSWPRSIVAQYRYFSPLVEMALQDVSLPDSISVREDTSRCDLCVRQFWTDISDLAAESSLISEVCKDAYSDVCGSFLADGPLSRFSECSGGVELLVGTPYECSAVDLTTSGLADEVFYQIGLDAKSVSIAAYQLELTMNAAVVDGVITSDAWEACQPCLWPFVTAIVELSEDHKTVCMNNAASWACGSRIATALLNFEACAGSVFELSALPSTTSAATTRAATATAATTPSITETASTSSKTACNASLFSLFFVFGALIISI